MVRFVGCLGLFVKIFGFWFWFICCGVLMVHVEGLIVFFAYTPSLALLWYFYHKDKLEPEPKRFVAFTFVFGASSSALVTLVVERFLLSFLPSTAFVVALVASVVEEPAKALALRLPFSRDQMDGIMDGVVYGGAAGLGFAATENLLYGLGFGPSVTIARGFLTPVAHAAWSIVIGVGFGLKSEGKIDSLFNYYLLAIVLHFAWNFNLLSGTDSVLKYLIYMVIIFVNIRLIQYFLRKGREEDLKKSRFYWYMGGRESNLEDVDNSEDEGEFEG